MARIIYRIIAIGLIAVAIFSLFGCATKTHVSVNGYPDAPSFKAYTVYGSGAFSDYISSCEKSFTDDAAEKNKELKLDGKKIKLVYETTEMDFSFSVYDKYVCEENSDVEISFYNRTDEIYKVEYDISSDEKGTEIFPECGDMLSENSYESYAKTVLGMLGCDISKKEVSYLTHYSVVNGNASSGNTVGEFFIPEEKDRLSSIIASYESVEDGDDKFDYSFYVIYDAERNVKSIRITCDLVPPKERFTLTEEEAMKVILERIDKEKGARLELIDGTYTIVYESGYKRIFKEMEYMVIFNNMVSLVVTTIDQTASGGRCLTDHYILPAEITFE